MLLAFVAFLLPFFQASTPAPTPLNPAWASDALARSTGNDRELARRVADRLFTHLEPAQVLRVIVDRAGKHHIAQLILSGVKFHAPLDEPRFIDEVLRLVQEAFSATPLLEEVDVTAVIPFAPHPAMVVGSDMMQPITQDVFTCTVLRSEALDTLRRRIQDGDGVVWDPLFRRKLHGHGPSLR